MSIGLLENVIINCNIVMLNNSYLMKYCSKGLHHGFLQKIAWIQNSMYNGSLSITLSRKIIYHYIDINGVDGVFVCNIRYPRWDSHGICLLVSVDMTNGYFSSSTGFYSFYKDCIRFDRA